MPVISFSQQRKSARSENLALFVNWVISERLTGVKFNNELNVYTVIKIIRLRKASDCANHLLTIDCEPVLKRYCLCKVESAKTELLGRCLLSYCDNVTWLTLVRSDVCLHTVHCDVTVVNKLTCCGTCVTETETVANVVETSFKKANECVTCDTALAYCLCVVCTELLLENTELETKLLLLTKSYRVVGLLTTTCTKTVLTWWEVTTLKSLRRSEESYTETAADFIFRANITCHNKKVVIVRLN
jgi:hypothetical protein